MSGSSGTFTTTPTRTAWLQRPLGAWLRRVGAGVGSTMALLLLNGMSPASAGDATHADTARQAPTATRVTHERGRWRVQAEAASRYETARALADLSHSSLPVGLEPLRAAPPLTLQWEGHDLAQAWRAVMGDDASYALHCAQGRCAVWVLATATPAAARPHHTTARAERAPLAAAEPSSYD